MTFLRSTSASLLVVFSVLALTVLYLQPLGGLVGSSLEPGGQHQEPAIVDTSVFEMERVAHSAIQQKNSATQAQRRRLDWAVDTSKLHGPDHPLAYWEKVDRWSIGYGFRYDPFFGYDY